MIVAFQGDGPGADEDDRERDEQYLKEVEELEGRSAKKNEIERAEKAKNKDFEDIRLRYEEEIGQLKQVWDTLKSMKPKQLIDDERALVLQARSGRFDDGW